MGRSLGGVPGPGREATDGEAPTEEAGRNVGFHLGGFGDSGGGVLDNGDLHLAKA